MSAQTTAAVTASVDEMAGQFAASGSSAGQAASEIAVQVGTSTVAEAAHNAGQIAGHVAEQALSVPAFSWSGYIATLGLLFLLLGGLWLALRLLKKRGSLKIFGVGDELTIETRLSLGPKKNLLVVRTPGKKLILGVTDHHISKLAELPLEDDESGNTAPRRAAPYQEMPRPKKPCREVPPNEEPGNKTPRKAPPAETFGRYLAQAEKISDPGNHGDHGDHGSMNNQDNPDTPEEAGNNEKHHA